MKELLWKELHYLFDTDDGSLPEIRITRLSPDGVAAIFSYITRTGRCTEGTSEFWSLEEQQTKPIDSVPNAAVLVTKNLATPFHFVCRGLNCNGVTVPDIGVFVFQEEIALDYRMGEEWDAAKLEAFFGILKELQTLDAGARVCLEDGTLPSAQQHFETAWFKYVASTSEKDASRVED